MRSLILSLLFSVWISPVLAAPSGTASPADERSLADAVFVRPLYGVYRHCGGACVKSGALSWYCFAKQTCYLSCATAPPQMKCAIP